MTAATEYSADPRGVHGSSGPPLSRACRYLLRRRTHTTNEPEAAPVPEPSRDQIVGYLRPNRSHRCTTQCPSSPGPPEAKGSGPRLCGREPAPAASSRALVRPLSTASDRSRPCRREPGKSWDRARWPDPDTPDIERWTFGSAVRGGAAPLNKPHRQVASAYIAARHLRKALPLMRSRLPSRFHPEPQKH